MDRGLCLQICHQEVLGQCQQDSHDIRGQVLISLFLQTRPPLVPLSRDFERMRTNVTRVHATLRTGLADANWLVNCSAVRRLARNLASPVESRLMNSLLVGYLEFLIAKARMRNVLPHGFDTSSPDLELLALLQHQGAATGLIEFTLQPLVALWFACNGSQTEDGAVYLLSRASTTEISERKDIERPFRIQQERNARRPVGGTSDDDGVVCERVRSRPPRPLGDAFLLGFLLGIPSLPAQSGQPISLIPAPGTLRQCHLYQARIKAGV